ncbi:MAG: hypothetical protein SD837_06765 [Candidatus Electrothrix scaldis]|nr:MAG: hypothetical protein SD837_06765 [Candidatus Electrothrix sp. GW3-3]
MSQSTAFAPLQPSPEQMESTREKMEADAAGSLVILIVRLTRTEDLQASFLTAADVSSMPS